MTYFLFPTVYWLASGFVYATLSLNWLTCRLKNLTSERASSSDIRQRLKHLLKNKFNSNYVMLVAFSSPLKFSKVVFPVWNFDLALGTVHFFTRKGGGGGLVGFGGRPCGKKKAFEGGLPKKNEGKMGVT